MRLSVRSPGNERGDYRSITEGDAQRITFEETSPCRAGTVGAYLIAHLPIGKIRLRAEWKWIVVFFTLFLTIGALVVRFALALRCLRRPFLLHAPL